MTTDPLNIDRALMQHLVDLALPETVVTDGVLFSPADDQTYMLCTNMPASQMAVTLGRGGEDENLGVFQISIDEPVANGGARSDAIASSLLSHYAIGKSFSYNGQWVTVTRLGRSPRIAVKNSARNRLAVSVYWRAHTLRPV